MTAVLAGLACAAAIVALVVATARVDTARAESRDRDRQQIARLCQVARHNEEAIHALAREMHARVPFIPPLTGC